MKKSILTVLLLLLINKSVLIAQIIPPYQNNFDTNDTIGWSHAALFGIDDWQIGVPDKYHTSSAFSSPDVWATSLSNWYPASYSSRVLLTPTFDLSNSTNTLVLSFFQKGPGVNGTSSILEYSINGGTTWIPLINATSQNRNWQNAGGFPCCATNSFYTYYQSVLNINFLQGYNSVRFRFNYTNGYVSGYMDGWVIDNFSIFPEFNNIRALKRDTIKNINKFFTKVPVNLDFDFINQYDTYFNFTNKYYFSFDSVKDSGDILLATKTFSANQSIENLLDTIPIPSNLSVGQYYILYDFDANNILAENSETDNSNFLVFEIDSIFESNYIDNFDTSSNNWNRGIPYSNSVWKKQPPNYFRMEKAHSYPNTFTIHSNAVPNKLETPYLNLSNKTNQTICLWYKYYNEDPYMFGEKMSLLLPPYTSFKVTNPFYSTTIDLPKPRNNNSWDCFCTHLSSAYDTVISTKFALASYSNGYDLIEAIDDFYIGESKPDISADFGDNTFFTSSSTVIDTLVYTLWNGGLEVLPSTSSKFYWSADSLFDASDILVANIVEPSIQDTLFMKRKVAITKPNLSNGEYFIFYSLDENNVVNEMREYNNIGYIKVRQNAQESLPYYNDFEISTNNWYHQAALGNDDWVCATPTKTVLSAAFSGTKAWVTSANSNMSQNSKMYLYTPLFDFTQLSHPVIEFDYKLTQGDMITGSREILNIDYSIDGGCTWYLLDTSSLSYSNFYYNIYYDSSNGTDYYGGNALVANPINNISEKVLSGTFRYQGRDVLNTTHCVVDLKHLKNYKKIMFRYKIFNANYNIEGAVVDNFHISNAKVDLAINYKKNLEAAPTDKFISTFFNVNNNGNFFSASTELKLYVSQDTILDISDSLIISDTIGMIRPNSQFYYNFRKQTNLLNNSWKYLIYSIDPNNSVPESNELNNVSYFTITNGSAISPIYSNNFNNYSVDGWTFYTGDNLGFYHHRFRHNRVMADPTYYFMYPNVDTTIHEWSLDFFDNIQCLTGLMPVNYIESPTFDFSSDSVYKMEFDFSCASGGTSGGNLIEGGNIQYTKDGGLTWNVITTMNDSTAEVLYNFYTPYIISLNNQQGWATFMDTTCKINLAFLAGVGNVKFRFAFKGKWFMCSTCPHGFRMDNFKIKSLNYIHESVDTTTSTSLSDGLVVNRLLKNMGSNSYIITKNNNCNLLYSKLFDVQGKEIISSNVFSCIDDKNLFVNLSELSSGMYFINLNENNYMKTFKVIVYH